MKKILLSLGFAALSISAAAQTATTIFSDDFEWLKPWSDVVIEGKNKGKAGDTVNSNGKSTYCPQLGTSKVEEVSTYQALQNKGYEFVVSHNETDKDGKALNDRPANEQIYLQTNYLKFGLTDYYSGIVLPALSDLVGHVDDATLTFDWCTMKQGSGKYDAVELVVIVKNGDKEEKVPVEKLSIQEGADFKWYPATVNLAGKTINKDTRIIIRNCDAQWPAGADGRTLRWFLDNIKLQTVKGAAVAEIEADQNAPVEYYNVNGVKVANPDKGVYIVKQGNKITKQILK